MRAEISSLFGLNVYTNAGTYVGKISDMVLDVNNRKVTGLAISDINREIFDVPTKGVIIPYRWVVTSGDIVIIRDLINKFKKLEKEAYQE
ncbi:PRC-barrel domain protein [Methanohalobium evestigatum Z-7303]|uniref:PRC-barrel domain protein n=1 Tax=Methanohalobium evestigatum (strain ATCC BAA-1072 / DSM 3721 / NBRC 107634 / OCM 161 / Z-7303) TaxID=644295 RepID=D7E950_METEZ|nr:PRC-barrel domain-containing protein [Methanohalobium evestigatum]ADI73998.1 PRC-barrel domain protein [Methanohalobium evestigatum Z-7303]